MAKARRGGKRGRRPPGSGGGSGDEGGGAAREHWRADGRPKTRFASQDEAHRAALQRLLEDRADLDAYRCTFCGGWHLGGRRE